MSSHLKSTHLHVKLPSTAYQLQNNHASRLTPGVCIILMSFLRTYRTTAPPDYTTPSFPSLYWPIPIDGDQTFYLYSASDIWRFTLLWSLAFFVAVHVVASGYAVAMQARRNWKVIWMVPIVYVVVGGIEAFVAGSIVGGLLGAVYNAGFFHMSTWIPFFWGLINALVLILSSFAIQGGL